MLAPDVDAAVKASGSARYTEQAPLHVRRGRWAPRSNSLPARPAPRHSAWCTSSYIPNSRRLNAQGAIAAASPLILRDKHACSHPALMSSAIEAPSRIPQRLAAIYAYRCAGQVRRHIMAEAHRPSRATSQAQSRTYISRDIRRTSSPQERLHHAPFHPHPPRPQPRQPRSLPALVLRLQQLLLTPHLPPP